MKITPVTARFWWPHRVYLEARRYRYNCYRPWRPYVTVVVGYAYEGPGAYFFKPADKTIWTKTHELRPLPERHD